ncbi:MAG: hypothetical protein Tsb0014_26450 [Pleurocapsa sp.]
MHKNQSFQTPKISTNNHRAKKNSHGLKKYDVLENSEVFRQQLEKFFLISMDLLCIAGFDGYFKCVNPAWSKILGYSSAELLAKPYLEFVHPEDLVATVAQMKKLEAGYSTIEFQNRYRAQDGTYRWLSWNTTVIKEQQLAYCVARDITENKRQEEQLRDSEQQLRLAFEAARMGSWNWNIQQDEIKWSSNLEALFGLEPGQFDGSYEMFVSSLHSDDRDRVIQAIENSVTTGADYDMEFRIVYPNGQIRWALSKGKVFYDQNGQPLQMVGVDLDITKHKQLEEQLRQKEERWQLALQGNNDGLWDWNIQTNEVFFSTHWREMLGYEEHEIGNHLDEWSKRVHPEDLEVVLQAVQNHLDKKTDFYVSEHRVQCKNGTYKWILDRGKALWDEAGNPVRMVGSHTDITERKATEQILKQQAIIFESISEGIVVTDLEGRIIDYNPAAEKMLGYSCAEVIGKTPAMFHRPEESSQLTQNILASIQQNNFWSGEIVFIRKDGTEGISETVVVPLENKFGQVVATVGINRDITEKKRREKILHNIMLGVSAKTGTAFFELLVKYLSQALDVEYAFISEVVEFTNNLNGKTQASRMRTIAGYGKGKLMDNFEYDLLGTPCEQVFKNQIVICCDRLQEKFPQDRFLVEMNAESYLGKSLFNSQGQNLGLIAVIDDKPLVDVKWMKEVIQIFAIRVSSELERRQAEYNLRQQAQIIDQIHDSVVATDLEGNITSWNKGAEKLFGYRVDEVLGRHIGIVYSQGQQEFLQNQIIAPLTQQGAHEIEVSMIKKSGKRFDAHLSLSLRKDENHNVIGMIGYSRDVSDRKRAEKQLQSQMMRSQLFTEISLKIRQSLQLEEILQTTVVEVQKLLNADRVLILRLEELTRLSIIQEIVKPGWDSALEVGFVVDNCLGSEYLLKYPQGRLYSIPDVENSDVKHCLREFLRRFQVKSKLVIPLLFQEKLWGMIVIHQCSHTRNWSSWEIDLLQQIANQLAIAIGQSYLVKELSSSKQRWATLTETVPVGIFLTDPVGNCLYINQFCSNITGMKARSVSGQRWFKFLHPEDRRRVVDEWKQAIEKHFPFACEHRFLRLDGKITWAYIQTIPEMDTDGKITGYIGTITDITERIKIEEIKLALEREKKMSELKLRFFSMASHEFRTPLSVIMFAAQVLENSEPEWLDTKKIRNIYRIKNSAQKITQMLTDVLILARAEAEKLELKPAKINLEQFCLQILEEIKTERKENRISLTYQGHTDKEIYLDEKLLHSILINLLSNAVKYSPEGDRVNFEVNLQEESVIFTIKDRGIGVPLRDRNHLFEAFHRGENVGKIEGTGLGLAVVKRCVDLQQGKISFESSPGQGTTFIVSLPLIFH